MNSNVLTAQAVFLGIATFNDAASQLEGLNRRFPEAWTKRQTYPYYKHRLFKSISLSNEYLNNLAYCLWEYSLENEALRAELKAMMIRIQPSIYRHYKKAAGLVLSEEYYQDFCREILNPKVPIHCLISFCVADFFVGISQISYDPSYQEMMYQQWDRRVRDYLKDENPKNLWGFEFLEIDDKMKDPAEVRRIQNFSKAYSEYLGCSVQDYLNRIFFDPTYFCQSLAEELAFATPTVLGMKIIDFGKSNLTQSDVLGILGQLTFFYERNRKNLAHQAPFDYLSDLLEGQIEIDETAEQTVRSLLEADGYTLPDTLTPELITFYDQYLPAFCAYYMLAKHHEANRDFFFKIKTNADTISLTSLENELTRTKKELKALKQQTKHHQAELVQVRTESHRQFQDRLKQGQEEVVLANQQIKRLSQENKQLKEEIAALKDSLTILTQQVEMQEWIDLNVPQPTQPVNLNRSNILIMGGHPHVVAKLKEKLPNCKFCECRRLYQDDFFKNVDYAYIFVEWLNHGMTGKLNKIRPDIPKRVIAATNPDRILSEMEAAYLKDLALNQVEA